MLYKDQLNRTVALNAVPKRIISLVPSQTELLVALGLESSIVGVTKFCVHPSNLKNDKVVVGGTKTIHLDKISALKPDLILCNKEENTQQIVEDCSNIAPVWVSDIKTVEDNLNMILQLGVIFQIDEISGKLIQDIKEIKSEFISFMINKPVRKVAYCIWKNPYMVAGVDTFVDSLLRLNNFENIFLYKEGRYPEVKKSELGAADLILLSSEPYPFKKSHLLELKNELQCEVRLVDGEYFSWYGSRIKNAFNYFKTLH